MNILIDIVLVLCGMLLMAAWIKGKPPTDDDISDAFESGWDIGYDAALTMVELHLHHEPVNRVVIQQMRDKRNALYHESVK